MTSLAVRTQPSYRGRTLAGPVLIGAGALLALLLAGGQARLLPFVYPPLALGIAVWLYRSRGFPAYLAFTWGLWFISPGVRRLADYYGSGWNPANPISLVPLLASALAMLTVLRRLPEIRRRRLVPWAVAALCIVTGYFAGVLQAGLLPATHAFLAAIVPLCLGLATALQWRRYPECAAAVSSVFAWGVLVLAIYAIVQFFVPPAWDRFWVDSSGMHSVGPALALKIRVFSLVNGPLACATIVMAGLFIALARRGPGRTLMLSVGGVALLLTLVRSVWIATAIGLLVYLAALPLRTLRRVILATAITLAAVTGLSSLLPRDTRAIVMETVVQRVQTLTNLEGDVSFEQRVGLLDDVGDIVLDHPFGHGLGSTGVSSALAMPASGIRDFDNGILAIVYSLGWFAGIGFLGAAIGVTLLGFARHERRDDLVAKAARAIVVASLALSLGGNVFEGLSGAVFWGFAGLLTAAHQWHLTAPLATRRSRS